VGGYNLGDFASYGTSATVTGLPTDGRTLYVRLYSLINGTYYYNDYTYASYSAAAPAAAAMVSPAPGSVLSGSSVTFSWTNAGASVYEICIGSSIGGYNVGDYASYDISTAVSGMPTDGRTLYVRLYSLIKGTYYYIDYTYTAFTATSGIQWRQKALDDEK
jgi:hypothetical protein